MVEGDVDVFFAGVVNDEEASAAAKGVGADLAGDDLVVAKGS